MKLFSWSPHLLHCRSTITYISYYVRSRRNIQEIAVFSFKVDHLRSLQVLCQQQTCWFPGSNEQLNFDQQYRMFTKISFILQCVLDGGWGGTLLATPAHSSHVFIFATTASLLWGITTNTTHATGRFCVCVSVTLRFLPNFMLYRL
jgi:hypothetical protein